MEEMTATELKQRLDNAVEAVASVAAYGREGRRAAEQPKSGEAYSTNALMEPSSRRPV